MSSPFTAGNIPSTGSAEQFTTASADIIATHLNKVVETYTTETNSKTPAPIRERTKSDRAERVPLPPTSEKDAIPTDGVRATFPEKTARMGRGGSWKVFYEWDAEKKMLRATADSVLPKVLSENTYAKAVDSLRSTELFDRAIQVLNSEYQIELQPQVLCDRANERFALTGALRGDLWKFVSIFTILQSDDAEGKKLFLEFVQGDYLKASFNLKKGKESPYIASDIKNWLAYIALLVARGGSAKELVAASQIDEEAHLGTILRWADLAKEGGVKALSQKNARIVGRLIVYEFMKDRFAVEKAENMGEIQAIDRVLVDTILLHILTLDPEDPEAKAVLALPPVEKKKLVQNLLKKP